PLLHKQKTSQPTHALIIGAGLTAAQLTHLLLSPPHNISKITLLARHPLRTKPFDVDLAWMGKFRNINQAYFYGADSDQDRISMIAQARGGGSITPPFTRHLRTWQARHRLDIRECSVVDWECSTFDEKNRTWNVRTTSTTNPTEKATVEDVDWIYHATGAPTCTASIPCLQTLLASHPIATCGGLPCLTEELQWRADVPCWVTGKMAGLRVGPGAGNLGGARVGAERVVVGVQEWLGRGGGGGGGGGGEGEKGEGVDGEEGQGEKRGEKWEEMMERRDSALERDEYTTARGNRFRTLDFAALEGDE
ncbi:hypothetical protein EJ05DRAFT_522445, partial [Pseudovirgaria hyperparasitica]